MTPSFGSQHPPRPKFLPWHAVLLQTYLPWMWGLIFLSASGTTAWAQIAGCTDPLANNYNANATLNDGSCTYNSSTLSAARSWTLPSSLVETSGLVVWNNRFWTHLDDSNTHLFELDTNDIANPLLHLISGVSNTDWEDITQDSLYLYIGDFGNNANGNRTDLHILRVEKSSLLAASPMVDTLWFSYADQTDFSGTGANNTDFDCEGFIAFEDSLFLFTKQWVSESSVVYALPKTPGTHTAQPRATLPVQGLVTGATCLPEKRLVILCGYSSLLQPFLYLLYDFQGVDFSGGNKRKIGLGLSFHQVEGITTENGLQVFISNEKFSNSLLTTDQKLHRLNLNQFLGGYLNGPVNQVSPEASSNLDWIYPNPSTGIVRLNSPSKTEWIRYSLTDGGGKTAMEGRYLDSLTLDVSHLRPGVYVLCETWASGNRCLRMVRP